MPDPEKPAGNQSFSIAALAGFVLGIASVPLYSYGFVPDLAIISNIIGLLETV